ncbi:hypothetical protein, partial [Stenotrophomonas maltophilia]|uniref:hypothetical protein n=1 Tax=Stenotrophomonas maltophilia TaxID=40324 RepID=UPI001A7E17AD
VSVSFIFFHSRFCLQAEKMCLRDIPFPAEKGSDPGSNRLLPLLLLFPFFDLPWLARTETVRGRAGWAAQGREPHGCGDRAYLDVLAASPAWPTPPGHARLLLS